MAAKWARAQFCQGGLAPLNRRQSWLFNERRQQMSLSSCFSLLKDLICVLKLSLCYTIVPISQKWFVLIWELSWYFSVSLHVFCWSQLSYFTLAFLMPTSFFIFFCPFRFVLASFFEACHNCILFLSLHICTSSPFLSYHDPLWLLLSLISYSRYPVMLYGAAACAAYLTVIPHDLQGCSNLIHMLQINPRDFFYPQQQGMFFSPRYIIQF